MCGEYGVDLPPYGSPIFLLGGIVGSVEIVDVLPRGSSAVPWKFEGHYGFVLREPRPMAFMPCRGALNFWRIPEHIYALVAQLDSAAAFEAAG